MVKTIKVDGSSNYFIDNRSESIMLNREFDPKKEYMDLVIDQQRISHKDIVVEFGGQIVVQQGRDKLIIDDGFRDVLVKAGYIVYKNYDEIMLEDGNTGAQIRDQVIEDCREAIKKLFKNDKSYNSITHGRDTVALIREGAFRYSIYVDTINTIVNKNRNRKDNNLSFYPFSKGMDKYGTLYVAIFAKRKLDHYDNQELLNSIKYDKADDIVRNLINELGVDYHWSNQIIKSNKVLNYKGL